MSAKVVRLRQDPCHDAGTPISRAVLDQLHGLLRLDPIAVVSPARVLFVVSNEARARLARYLAPGDAALALDASALALVGYDFPFAVSLLIAAAHGARPAGAAGGRPARPRAALQGDCLRLAASAVGLEARAIANFDAAALRAEFFAGSEATVVGLCRLAPEASLMAASAFDGLAYHID
jgi:3-hydroxypropanoate dehydrogenase